MSDFRAESDPQTLEAINKLAIAQQAAGNYELATELHRRLAELRTQLHGPNHPFTLNSKQNLGSALLKIGQFDEAEKIAVEVLKAREQVQSDTHRFTLTCMGLLSAIFNSQGRYRKSRELQKELLNRSRDALGEHDPTTLIAQANYAASLGYTGQLLEGVAQARKVLQLGATVWGDHSLPTLQMRVLLAEMLYELGAHEESETISKVTLDLFQSNDESHPIALHALYVSASAKRELGKLDQAEKAFRDVYAKQREKFGEQHLDTLETRQGLAITIGLQGDVPKAVQMLDEVHNAKADILGETAPSTLKARCEHGRILSSGGQHAEAAEIWEDILNKSKQTEWADHHDYFATALSLAIHQVKNGSVELDERVLQEIQHNCKAIVVDGQYENLNRLKELGQILKQQGREDLAKKLEVASSEPKD